MSYVLCQGRQCGPSEQAVYITGHLVACCHSFLFIFKLFEQTYNIYIHILLVAYPLDRVRRGVAQTVARQLAVRQARIRISALHPRGGPLPRGSHNDTKRVQEGTGQLTPAWPFYFG